MGGPSWPVALTILSHIGFKLHTVSGGAQFRSALPLPMAIALLIHIKAMTILSKMELPRTASLHALGAVTTVEEALVFFPESDMTFVPVTSRVPTP